MKNPFKKEKSNPDAVSFAEKAKKGIDDGMRKMGNEAKETREMAELFYRQLAHKLKLDTRKDPPTEDEVREAIEQLKDVGRFSVFATGVIIPGGVLSLVGLEMLSRKFGIKGFTFIPSSFRKNAEWKYPKGYKPKKGMFAKRKKGDITDVEPI